MQIQAYTRAPEFHNLLLKRFARLQFKKNMLKNGKLIKNRKWEFNFNYHARLTIGNEGHSL